MTTRIKYNRDLQKDNRPYFIIADNTRSTYRITRIKNFDSLNKILNKSNNKLIYDENFFDNKYLKKIKSNAIRYPDNKKM